MVSFDGLEELAVGKSFCCHTMVGGCLVAVREATLGEGLVFLGLHWKEDFSTLAFKVLGIGLALEIELLGTHL